MNDLVSVIMPSYNTAEYISKSISSVLAQTYQNWELIIIDDCSTDHTDETIAAFLSDSRIRYLKNNANSGAAVSRNYALQQARGKWIAFLDSDDLWEPLKLEKQIAFMKKNGYHFSYTAYSEIDRESRPNGKTVSGPERIRKTGMYNYCWPGCLTVMYDAEIAGLVQIADIKANNDYAMWLKIIHKADCYLLRENLAKYRVRSGSISNRGYLRMIKWHYKLFRVAEKKNVAASLIHTVRNIFFGVMKKLIYVKKAT